MSINKNCFNLGSFAVTKLSKGEKLWIKIY